MPTIKERLKQGWRKHHYMLMTVKSAILLVEKTDGITLEDDKVIEILATKFNQRNKAMFEFKREIDRFLLS